MGDLSILENRLGYHFKDRTLLKTALTHKSSKQPYNNERLEFLGDAVLDLIVGEYLYHKFPTVSEGELSKLRASLVNEKGFEQLARLIDLGEYIYLSLAEENNNGRQKPSILSNAFEALIGAVYLESGLKEATKISLKLLEKAYPKIDLETVFKDYKTTLQEITQAHMGVTPQYVVTGSSGPDHQKEFVIMVKINNREIAQAKGKSKKEAQQEAAKQAIEKLKRELR
ncbi:MAG: ribonuclease III [Sulfurospirillum sp.]|nr:MAG: ribonuclease III [Sulfurospirillum sp.]